MDEALRNDLDGLAACVRKVRWNEAFRERAADLADRLSVRSDRLPLGELLHELEELSRSPDSVRYSFAEQRRSLASPGPMSTPHAQGGEAPDSGPVSGGRELVLFLLSLVRKSVEGSRG